MDYRVHAGEIPEDQTTAMMESYSAKLPTSFFLGAAIASIAGALILKTTGKDHHAPSSASGRPRSFSWGSTTRWSSSMAQTPM